MKGKHHGKKTIFLLFLFTGNMGQVLPIEEVMIIQTVEVHKFKLL